MTIYWQRCSICGKYIITLECTLNPQDLVCPHCCVLFCDDRLSMCSNPVWYKELSKESLTKSIYLSKKKEKEKIEKVLTDLLKKLEK